MLNVRVKICGIKDIDTALAAVDCGADALGFVFAPGRRQAAPDEVRYITAKLPPFVAKVGVFVNAPPAEVRYIRRFCMLDCVQLHGDEPAAYAAELDVPLIKAFRVKDAAVLQAANEYPAQAVLLDSYVEGAAGGTGRVFNWQLLRDVPIKKPLILAGGLNAANVSTAVSTVMPYAVDVSSGVETDGVKDIEKIRLFISRAKRGLT